ncbi:2575_t:CDS:2, partial [Ambispora leptoticha]
KGLIALNLQQIYEILQHPKIDRSNPTNLLYHIFMHLSILLVMHGGEHYQLKINQFKIDRNGSIQFIRYTSKNNQCELQTGQAQTISNPLDTSKPYYNIPEQTIMQLTGHKSVQGIHAYKQINEDQQLHTINTLINITEANSDNNNSNS